MIQCVRSDAEKNEINLKMGLYSLIHGRIAKRFLNLKLLTFEWSV